MNLPAKIYRVQVARNEEWVLEDGIMSWDLKAKGFMIEVSV